MKIEVSNGELLDRVSILELKMLKIDNPSKLANIEMQFNKINPLCVKLFEENNSTLQSIYLRLAKINGILWDLENKVRDPKIEDKEFINTSKLIFKYNMERNRIKNDINIATNSDFMDIKEHKL
tara:strand:- start:1526 stop:1897 length:372 start_codon:yes stop_codon:yes gene_type:complete